jgi:hypothetical protein
MSAVFGSRWRAAMLVVISAMVSAGSMGKISCGGTADDNAARVAVQKFRHRERSTAEKAPAANSSYFLREDGLMPSLCGVKVKPAV